MPQLLGQHNVVQTKHLRIWAERGLIHIEDSRDNSYEAVSVRTELMRMKAIQEMLMNSREDMKRSGNMHAAEYDSLQRMLEEMIEVCTQAKAQGMPSDPRAARDLADRRPKTVVVPDMKSIRM